MAKRYCLDTSGISNPLQNTPEDIHTSFWEQVTEILASGDIAVTQEIYDELVMIDGSVGAAIVENHDQLVLEITDGSWDWQSYLSTVNQLSVDYAFCISEYNNGKKGTVGYNDLSIIAMAHTLGLPVVSMEKRVADPNSQKRTIPNVCDDIGVEHLDFHEFVRREKIKN